MDRLFPETLGGFLATLPPQAAERLSRDPRIEFVEENWIVEMSVPQTSATRTTSHNNQYLWFLDRLDERFYKDRDSTYEYCSTGANVYAYVIDSGVYANHSEFGSRVVRKENFTNESDPTVPNCWHGTGVASVLAGSVVGVADGANVVSLKGITCDGEITAADFQEATTWIIGTDPSTGQPYNPYKSSAGVVNFSAWGPLNTSPSMESSVTAVVNAGFPFFTSADNVVADACRFAPNNYSYPDQNSSGPLVVGATSPGGDESTEDNDYRYQVYNGTTIDLDQDGGSNTGSCVSLWAPGGEIYSARVTSTTAYGFASGSSFSSPIAAGIAARYTQDYQTAFGSKPSPQTVYNFILNNATYWDHNSPANRIVKNTAVPGHYLCKCQLDTTIRGQFTPCASGCALQGHGLVSGWQPAVDDVTKGMIHWEEGPCQTRLLF